MKLFVGHATRRQHSINVALKLNNCLGKIESGKEVLNASIRKFIQLMRLSSKGGTTPTFPYWVKETSCPQSFIGCQIFGAALAFTVHRADCNKPLSSTYTTWITYQYTWSSSFTMLVRAYQPWAIRADGLRKLGKYVWNGLFMVKAPRPLNWKIRKKKKTNWTSVLSPYESLFHLLLENLAYARGQHVGCASNLISDMDTNKRNKLIEGCGYDWKLVLW